MSEPTNNADTASNEDKKTRPNFRRKKSNLNNGWPDVQIFDLVLPPKQVDLSQFEEYLTIKCNDGAEILIPKLVATSTSLWMRRLLSSNFKEKQTLSVEFKEFSGPILEEILRFCIQDYLVNKPNYDEEILGQKQPRVVFQFYIHPSVVMEMLMAADFLQIPALLELSSLMLAHYIDYVPSFAGIAPDLILGVFARVNPIKLCGLEDRPEYKALKLDTAPIWYKHCLKKDYKALGPVFSWDRNPMLKQYLDTLHPEQQPKVSHIYNDDQHHQVVEDLNVVDWKRMYLERDLNLRLFFLEYSNEKHAKINGENNSNNNNSTTNTDQEANPDVEPEEDDSEKVDILDYLDDVAPYISYLKVTMSNFNLAPFLGHLTKLQLTKFQLTKEHAEVISKLNKVTDLLLTEMNIRDTTNVATILSALTNLSVLDLSDNNIDDNGIVPLCRVLATNNSLLRLSVAYNNLGGPSMGLIFSSLKKHLNIELLDISHNNIFAMDVEEDRFRDLKNNMSLKHVILDENPLGVDLVHKAFFNFKLARHSPTALNALFANIPNQLLSLSLRSTDMIPEHINTLASHWTTNTLMQIEFLSLANNEVRDEGAQALRDILQVNRSIKVLDLTRCDLKQQGAEALAVCLQLNDCLEHLILDRNKIHSTGAIKLVDAIKKNTRRGLKSLHFKLTETNNDVTVRLEEELEAIGVVPYSDSTPDSTWRYKR